MRGPRIPIKHRNTLPAFCFSSGASMDGVRRVGPEFTHWFLSIEVSSIRLETSHVAAPGRYEILGRILGAVPTNAIQRVVTNAAFGLDFIFQVHAFAQPAANVQALGETGFEEQPSDPSVVEKQRARLQFEGASPLPATESIRLFSKIDWNRHFVAALNGASDRVWAYEVYRVAPNKTQN